MKMENALFLKNFFFFFCWYTRVQWRMGEYKQLGSILYVELLINLIVRKFVDKTVGKLEKGKRQNVFIV